MLMKKEDNIIVLNISKKANPKLLYSSKKMFEKFFDEVLIIDNNSGLYLGSREIRLLNLNKSIMDNKARAIIFTTGGFGGFEVLKNIDYEKIKSNYKYIIGMSGNSVLLNAIAKKTDCITYLHSNFEGFSLDKSGKTFENFKDFFIMGKNNIIEYFEIINTSISVKDIEGIAIGGNLRSIESLIGTEFEPEWKDKILFIEETERGIGDFIRMFWHFKYCGIWEKLNALVIGHIDAPIEKKKLEYFYNLLKEENVQCFKTESFGHNCPNAVIPIGGKIRIDAGLKKIIYIR